ncbi:MAG: type VI secretion system baseplate subunit TssG, partial [Desulfosarcinaceae bacterium]
PLNQADFLRFTPGNPGYNDLVSLTELFVTEPLAYDVELILASGQARTVCLGDRVRSSLGVTTWVFSHRNLGEVHTRFIVNRN